MKKLSEKSIGPFLEDEVPNLYLFLFFSLFKTLSIKNKIKNNILYYIFFMIFDLSYQKSKKSKIRTIPFFIFEYVTRF